ncbi:MAG: ABC transporter substrate-binding protein [Methylocystaceae bacterium]
MKKFLIIAILISMVLIVGGCFAKPQEKSSAPQTKAEYTAKVATLRGPSAVSIIPMIDAKTSLSEKVKAEYQLYNSPDILAPDLIKGQVDAALLPPNLAAKLYNKGADYQLVGVTCWGVMYLASNNPELTSIKQLKGQQLFITDKGATPDLVLKYLLAKNNMSANDVKLDYSLGQTELAQNMAAGRVNAGLLVEPWLTVVTSGNPKVNTIIDIQKEWQAATDNQPLPQTCLVVKKSLIAEHPEVVASLVKEINQAIEWVNAHPQEAGALVERNNIGMKAAVIAKAIPRLNLRFENAAASRPAIQSFFKIINQADPTSTGGRLPDDGFYYQK